MIIDGELNIELICCRETFQDSDILSLKEKYVRGINDIVNYLKNENEIHFTPTDFDAVEINNEDLNILFNS